MKEFKLGEQTLTVSDGLEEYNELHHEYVEAAKEARSLFGKIYQEQNDSMEDIAARGKEQIEESMEEAYFVSLRHLLDNDIYDIDKDLFCKFCEEKGLLSVYDVHKNNLKKLIAVNQYVASERERRDIRKANRIRPIWIAEGASGMLGAVAMDAITNSVTGMVHSGVNAIGNWNTKRKAQKMKDGVFKDDNTLKEYQDAIYDSAFKSHYGYIDILEDRKKVHIEKYEPEAQRNALAVNNNIAMLVPEKERAERMAVQMLSLDPYHEEYYGNLITNYGDENGEIQKIGEFFHMDIDEVKRDLQHKYMKNFSFEDIKEIQSVVDKLDKKAEYFGLQDEDREELDLQMRRRFCKWVLKKTYDEQMLCYLLYPDKKKEIMALLNESANTVKEQMNRYYEECFTNDSRYIVPPEKLPLSVHLLVTQNTEREAVAFYLDDIGIAYGKDEKIAYGYIEKIEIQEHMLILNDVVRIPIIAELEWKELEQYIQTAVSYLRQQSFAELSEKLELGRIESEQSKKLRNDIIKMLTTQSGSTRNIWCNITVFDTASAVRILEYNNIKVTINTFCGNKDEYTPLFWLYNGEEVVLFTENGIVFTNSGVQIDYQDLEDIKGHACVSRDDRILIQSDGREYSIFHEECYEIQELTAFADVCIRMLQKKDAHFEHQVRMKQDDALLIEPFTVWMDKMLYSRIGNEGVEDFSNFLFANVNDRYFTAFASIYYHNIEMEEEESILFFVKPVYYERNAIVVTTKNIYIYNGNSVTKFIALKQFEDVTIDHRSELKEIKISYDNEGIKEQVIVGALCKHENVARRSVWAERLLKIAFGYAKEPKKENLPEVFKEEVGNFIEREYLDYTSLLSGLRSRLVYFAEKTNRDCLGKWIENAREVYLSSTDYEQILLFYNSVKVAGGNAGVVLTDRYLYVRGKEIFKIAIADIEEIRVSDLDIANLEIAANGKVYSTTLKGYPHLLEFGDLLSDIVFYVKENTQDIIEYLDEKEMEQERRNARRNVAYTMKEEQKDTLQKLADYCMENEELGLFGEEQDEILFNDESETFIDAFKMAVESSDKKPDAVEVPLFLIRPREGKKKLFGGKTTALFVTNERWYNVKCGGLGQGNCSVSFEALGQIDITPASKIAKPKVVAKGLGECEGQEYILAINDEEHIELYKNFFSLVLNMRENLMMQESKEADEKEMLSDEALKLCESVSAASSDEIGEVLDKLLSYDYDIAAKAECMVEKRQKELSMESMITVSADETDVDELMEQRNQVLESKYPFRYKRNLLEELEERIANQKELQIHDKREKVVKLLADSNLEQPVFGRVGDNRRGYITMAQMSKNNDSISIGDPVLLSALVEKKPIGAGGYIVLSDKIIICKNKKMMAYPVHEIEKFVINDLVGMQSIAFYHQGKMVTLTDMHRKKIKEYAALLTQITKYLSDGIVTPMEQISIETVTLKDKAQNAVQKAEGTMNDMKDKFSNIKVFGKKTESVVADTKEDKQSKPEEKDAGNSVSDKFAGKMKFASGFGKKEEDKKICPNCGAQVKANGKFCGKCGHKF